MKQRLSILLILLILVGAVSFSLLPRSVQGQQTFDSAQSYKRGAAVAQSITSAAAGSLVPVTGYTYVEVRYSGTYTTNATAAGFQTSLNGGTNWDDTPFFQRGTTNYCERLTVTGDLTDNSTNRWIVPLHGADSFRTSCLNWASGTINVIIVPFTSPASPCDVTNLGNPLSDAIDSITANTEMPAAAALADNTANPTVPGVGSFLMGWDGSTWDRVPATSAGGFLVDLGSNNDVAVTGTVTANQGGAPWSMAGNVASGSTDSGNPVKVGAVGINALPTAVTNGQRVNQIADLRGRQLIVPGVPRTLLGTQATTISSTTETTIVTALGANIFADLVLVLATNTSATAVRVDFRDSTGGTIRFPLLVPAGQTAGFSLPGGNFFPQATANNNWTAQLASAVTDIRITVLYAQNQ